MKIVRGSTGAAFAWALLLPFILPMAGLADNGNGNSQGNGNGNGNKSKVQQVLLISIDGFHAVDLEICVAAGTCPNLASLTQTGVTYTNASTTKPSDSFPGLLAQITGGTPKSTGIFYDDSYDRTLFAPGSTCTVGPGTEMNIAEPLDYNPHSIDGGANASLTGLNSAVAINSNNLPGSTAHGSCTPVWPHNLVRTNTIFGVLHAQGLRTAWADKHPAYDIINGSVPTNQPSNGPGTNVDDFFAPEINSDLSQANIDLIKNLGLKSTAPAPAIVPGLDFTGSIDGVEWYDGIKVQAILNEINGFDHTGTKRLGTPTLFGMNFQSVSAPTILQALGLDPTALNAVRMVGTTVLPGLGQ